MTRKKNKEIILSIKGKSLKSYKYTHSELVGHSVVFKKKKPEVSLPHQENVSIITLDVRRKYRIKG